MKPPLGLSRNFLFDPQKRLPLSLQILVRVNVKQFSSPARVFLSRIVGETSPYHQQQPGRECYRPKLPPITFRPLDKLVGLSKLHWSGHHAALLVSRLLSDSAHVKSETRRCFFPVAAFLVPPSLTLLGLIPPRLRDIAAARCGQGPALSRFPSCLDSQQRCL